MLEGDVQALFTLFLLVKSDVEIAMAEIGRQQIQVLVVSRLDAVIKWFIAADKPTSIGSRFNTAGVIAMPYRRVVLEIGMGTDIRGADPTKAAVRALRDALCFLHNACQLYR